MYHQNLLTKWMGTTCCSTTELNIAISLPRGIYFKNQQYTKLNNSSFRIIWSIWLKAINGLLYNIIFNKMNYKKISRNIVQILLLSFLQQNISLLTLNTIVGYKYRVVKKIQSSFHFSKLSMPITSYNFQT